MISQINQILNPSYIHDALDLLLINQPITILRTIARTGRNGSSVPWVYWENNITGRRTATFISFTDLLQGFWAWLETIQLLVFSFWEKQAIAQAIWHAIEVGDWVYHRQWGKVQIVNKDRCRGIEPRLWIRRHQMGLAIDPLQVHQKQLI